MTDARGTISLRLQLLTEATQAAQANQCTPADQVERWARLGRALEAHSDFSSANVDAAASGTMRLEELNCLERIAFFERVPKIFSSPSAKMVAAYASLSDDPNTGTSPGHREHGRVERSL